MIYIAIGSNLPSKYGNRFKNIELAISFLKEEKIKIINRSSFYETFSYPNKKDPKFINIVISVQSDLTPPDLMEILLKLMKKIQFS